MFISGERKNSSSSSTSVHFVYFLRIWISDVAEVCTNRKCFLFIRTRIGNKLLFVVVVWCAAVSHIYNPLNAMNMNFSWCFVRIQEKMGYYIEGDTNGYNTVHTYTKSISLDWTMEIGKKNHSTTVNICQHIKMPFDTTNAVSADSLHNNHNHISHHTFRSDTSFSSTFFSSKSAYRCVRWLSQCPECDRTQTQYVSVVHAIESIACLLAVRYIALTVRWLCAHANKQTYVHT